ncbi:NACHT, LRR and PYD domains-containing protein 12-like isoform X2 [Onychostoma macrolepis]|uniref:NACHT, LRR and PYD domains-containing protein 12-like isoform X2 n=1 Tax=Onychostoma macrolepis TaxID=369639 RepID=UPI00272B924B|nr:NACHT, LRR and PYD domains-containing protein 12-like isoform X2 [Onychostoma macrolepis]
MDETQTFRDGDFCPEIRIHQEKSDRETGQNNWKRSQRISIRDQDNASQVDSVVKRKLNLKFQCLYEGTPKQGTQTLLNEIYTELYITEGQSDSCNEHEVRQIETQSRRAATEDTAIKCNDIFRSLPGQDKPIRIVLTKGVAGIGKTVSVQKFILDWAEGKDNQDIHLIFPLPFREINLIQDQKLSLLDLLHMFFTEIKELDISSSEYKVLFIFDGLDECRLSLDFQSDVRLCDVTESASVDVLLMNLIVGNLLPSAFIWITSRPAAADLVPSECVHRVTEVRGFSEPQKEEYFRKRISDQSLANRITSHLKSSRSLYIMCHIPVFCWISATVLEMLLSPAERGEIPKTLTQMYTHFLILQTNIKHEKDYAKTVKDGDMILKLGKLAFQQLVKGNLIFYEEDLRECGIDVTEASVYSGLCTQIFREEFGLYQGKVFCFVHLSIQEHLAALYGHLSFINDNINVFDLINKERLMSKCFNLIKCNSSQQILISNLHQKAVDKTLHSKNGHLDLFLRFLLGFSLDCNQTLLQGLLTQTGNSSHNKEKTVQYIKKKIKKNPSPEKFLNLFHCLNELGDCSLMEQIQHYVTAGTVNKVKLSSSQWSALIFVLLTSEQDMNVFKLKDFVGSQIKADEVLLKLLPVVKEYRSAQLNNCGVTDEGCAALTSALRSNPSHLRELNVSGNILGSSGVKLFSSGLENHHCKLEKLWLRYCEITDEGCAALASALISNPSHLRELDLSWNKLGDSGVNLLSDGLKDPQCKLEKLCLSSCDVTDEGCAALASVMTSNPSHLRELDLSWNKLRDSGVKLLSGGLENPHCKLEILWFSGCGVTYHGCAALDSALKSNPSHLRELDLTKNKLTDSGVKLLSAIRNNADYKLETLRL